MSSSRNFWRWCRSSAPNTRAKHSGKRPFSASKRSSGRQLKAPSAHNLRLSNIFSCNRIGIAINATLGSTKNQLEVSVFCNQYKYALPTSDQDVRQEARGHCLLSIYLCLGGDHHHACSVLCRPEFVVLCKPQKRHFDAANVLFRQGILQSLPQARVSS